MKLHLGYGNLYLDDYINVDRYSGIADLKVDITDLSVINNNKVSEIYMSHVLEHFKRSEVLNFLSECNRVLKIGGILRVSVPDFDQVVKVYNKNKNIAEVVGLLNGGQKNDYDIHFLNYNFEILKETLEFIGFHEIQRYDSLEFLKEKDDYSKAFIPHMDFENGELMSLNIICKKNKNYENNKTIPNNLKSFFKIK